MGENKSNKDNKKTFFGRRKKRKDDKLTDEELDLAINFSDGSSGSNEEMSDDGLSLDGGMEDMGFGGLEDIFRGGEESETAAMSEAAREYI